MPQKVRVDAFLYACRAGSVGYDRLHCSGRIARMPVALKQESRLPPLEMSAQFVCQHRQDRHVAIGPPFSMEDVNLRWIAIQKQTLRADVHEFIHTRTGLEQGLDHQAVLALAAISGLNQALHLAWLQPGDRSVARARRLEPQPTPDSLHHVFSLIVSEMMLAPEAEGFLDDWVEGNAGSLFDHAVCPVVSLSGWP